MFKINNNSILHLQPVLPSCQFSSNIVTKIYVSISPLHSTYPLSRRSRFDDTDVFGEETSYEVSHDVILSRIIFSPS
jgi:hypothetical protein